MAKYPLEALARVRERKVEQALRDLDDAVQARVAAEARRVAAERRRDEHVRDATRRAQGEDAALDRGELRSFDLEQRAAWASMVAQERRVLEEVVETLRAEEATAIEGEARAGARLVETNADAEVLATHRERWTSAQRAGAERKEEDLSLDSWRGAR
jgi:hypothetical protein